MPMKGSRLKTAFAAALALVLTAGATPRPALATKGCNESQPGGLATPPQTLWGDLRPAGVATADHPAGVIWNTTNYTGNQRADQRYPLATSVDIENDTLYVSYWAGLAIFDASGAKATDPVKLSIIDGWSGAFPQGGWPSGATEVDQYVYAVDVPTGDTSVAALGGITPVGFAVVDTSNKSAPFVRYQDGSKSVQQLWAGVIGGRSYAFTASLEGGIYEYDMTAAKSYTACLEFSNARTCPGVYKMQLSTTPHQYVQGLAIGNKTYLAASTGSVSTGVNQVNVWDVTNPAAPALKFQGTSSFTIYGIALFERNGDPYIAVRRSIGRPYPYDEANIYNLGCMASSSCSNFPAAASSQHVVSDMESSNWKPITYSLAGTVPTIYLGNFDLCHSDNAAGRLEYLYDVSNPAAPKEIISNSGGVPTTIVDQGVTVDYWSWYNSDTLRGWGFLAGRVGKFNGNLFYRAAHSVLDIHQWGGGTVNPPVASFTWSPDQPYVGDTVTFTDTSSGSPSSRTWTFPGGSPAGSTALQPQVTFSGPGTKSVHLEACNDAGCDPNGDTRSVVVLDPSPQVSAVSASPSTAYVCQPVTLSATATGRAPLAYTWALTGPGTVPGGSGNPYVWDTTGTPAGSYTATVTVSGTGTPATGSTGVTLLALPTLPGNDAFAPTNDAFSFGTVQFHVNAPGATAWSWDFGDGNGFGAWTSDPTNGPNPVVTYTSTGSKTVRVKVRNCVDTTGSQSAPLTVNVTQVTPLTIDSFQAGCNFGICSFAVGSPVTFVQSFSGSPTGYAYDWDGNGSFEEQSATPVLTHTYNTAGTFSPVVKAIRGAESVTRTHSPAITVAAAQASITVSGPSSGTVSQGLSFSVSAQNCTPNANGWSWTATGTSVFSTTSSATITFTSAGTKNITVTNSACGSAQGVRSVSITDPNTGGKSISIAGPTSGSVGATLTFTASATGCTPAATWTWNAGGGAIQGSATGSSVSISWSSAGSKNVTATNSGCSGTTGTKSVSIGDVVGSTCGETVGNARACFTFSPGNPATGQAVSFDASTSTGSILGYSWSFGDNTTGAGKTTSHGYTAGGTYPVTLSVATCASPGCIATVTRNVVVTGAALPVPSFTVTGATCESVGLPVCNVGIGQTVSFTDTSTGATSRSWSFGDGGTSTDANPTHAFKSGGTFSVVLTATNAAGSASTSRAFIVAGAPAPSPAFTSSACGAHTSGTCTVEANHAVSFTETTTGTETARSWAFGDGDTSSATTPSHTWTTPGTYNVVLTAFNGSSSDTAQQTFVVTPSTGKEFSLVVPWTAQSDDQATDLSIFNPDAKAMDVELTFLRRGRPDDNPPKATVHVEAGATKAVRDALTALFGQTNLNGFVVLRNTSSNERGPVVGSFSRTLLSDGTSFSEPIPGLFVDASTGKALTTGVEHVIGLSDDGDRRAVFGISNPGTTPASYRLKAFDRDGNQIGATSPELSLPRRGQKQFQPIELGDLFDVSKKTDYRIEVETVTGGPLFAWGNTVRVGSLDPAFVPAREPAATQWLMPIQSTLKGSAKWVTDLVISNPSSDPLVVNLGVRAVGTASVMTNLDPLTLAGGESRRLSDVLGQWPQTKGAVSFVQVTGSNAAGGHPAVQAEVYDKTLSAADTIAQAFPAFGPDSVASAGDEAVLVGLSHKAGEALSTVWIVNPSNGPGAYVLRFRALDGTLLKQSIFRVPAGKLRQVPPAVFVPKTTGPFTLEVQVRRGQAIAAAQVFDETTGVPSIVLGGAR